MFQDQRRCGSSKSSKSCGPPISPISDPLTKLATLLKDRSCKDIIIMAGAGISTASGIPDFRSPGTGLYYNTSKYNVSCPTDVFDLKYFNKNPYPFMDIIRDFIKTEKDPNATHGFCKLLETKGLLLRMYTQNIDGLEKKSGISPSRLVEAHGTMETASCVKCLTPHSTTRTEKMIINGKIPSCKRKGCEGFVKPDIIMFGEELPKKFYLYPKDFEKCDLLLVMGTSLNVEPFSELVDAVPKSVPRVLFNRDCVGPFADSRRKNDIFIRGDIGASIHRLVKMLGWSKALSGISDNCGSDGERTSSRADSGSSDQTIVTRTTTSTSVTPDSTAKSVSHHTWAASRTSISQVSSPCTQDSIAMPNSVVRNVSDQSLVQKVSSLSLTESISTAPKSESISTVSKSSSTTRRSVSAPLPKNTTSKVTINTVLSPSFSPSDETLTNSDMVETIVSSTLSPASSKSTFIGQDMINVQDNTENKNPNSSQKTPILEERKNDNDSNSKASSVSKVSPSESENFVKMKVLKSDENLVWMSNPLGSSVRQIPKQLPLISEQPTAQLKETLYDTVQTVMSNYSDLSIQNIKSEVSNLSDKSSVDTVLSCTPATILNCPQASASSIALVPSRLSITKTPINLIKRRNLDKNIMTLKGLATKEQSLPGQIVPGRSMPAGINTQRSFSSLLTPEASDVLKTELKTFITKKLKASSKREEKAVKERKSKKSSDSPTPKKRLPFSVPKAASPKGNSPTKGRKSSTKPTPKDLHQWRLSPCEVEVLAKGHIPSTLTLGAGKKFVNNRISSKSWTPESSTNTSRRNVKKQVVLYSVGISSKPDYKWITNDKSRS